MRNMFWIAVLLGLTACGGASSSPGGSGGETSGGEAVITCSVPNAPAMEEFIAASRQAHAGDAAAVPAFESACDAGNPCACTEAGEAHIDAGFVEHDYDRGMALLDRGCQGGDSWGCWALAHAIWRFRPTDIAHAVELTESACEADIPAACGELGRFRMSGIGDHQVAAAEAVRLYDSACTDGASYSCYFLGEAFLNGIGTEADPARALELLTWACDTAQIPQACTGWANTLPTDDAQRQTLLRRGCDTGDPIACDELDPESLTRTGTADASLTAGAAQALTAGASLSFAGPLGGAVDVSGLGLRRACFGFVDGASDAVITVPAGITSMTIRADADADTIVAVRDPSGHWTCADDSLAGDYHGTVTIAAPAAGQWAVWAGGLRTGELPGSISVSGI